MSNFKADILRNISDNEQIEGVVIGAKDWSWDDTKPSEVLTWEQAAPLLDYEYSTGYGAPECHAVYVWTDRRVFFVVQYDGSTGIYSIPRNPTACVPEMPGG